MIKPLHRNLSYAILALLFISGVAHFVLHDYFTVQGPFGPAPNPWESWVLRLHGAAAMLSLIVIGSVLPPHVVRFWRIARNRLPGAAVLTVLAVLVVSGYGLYYFGGDQLRLLTRQVHIVVGLLALPVFAAHVWYGVKARYRRCREEVEEQCDWQSTAPAMAYRNTSPTTSFAEGDAGG